MPGLVVSRKLDSSVTVGPIRITVVGWGHRPGSRDICQVKLLIEAPADMHIERDDCRSRVPRERPAPALDAPAERA
jgi:sRNA-binding carbon storage regulator CsrA